MPCPDAAPDFPPAGAPLSTAAGDFPFEFGRIFFERNIDQQFSVQIFAGGASAIAPAPRVRGPGPQANPTITVSSGFGVMVVLCQNNHYAPYTRTQHFTHNFPESHVLHEHLLRPPDSVLYTPALLACLADIDHAVTVLLILEDPFTAQASILTRFRRIGAVGVAASIGSVTYFVSCMIFLC